MKSSIYFGLILFGAFLLGFDSSFASEDLKNIVFKGYAWSEVDRSKLEYMEEHSLKMKEGMIFKSETRYLNKDGKLIASLNCDYSKDYSLPDFVFTDERTGYWERVEVNKDKINIKFKESLNSEVEQETLERESGMSGSQGLNQFIVTKLPELKKGESVKTDFLIPSRFTSVGMNVSADKIDGDNVKVKISLSSVILNIFAPKMVVTYNEKTGRLLRYEGKSNIKSEDGDLLDVIIKYDYHDKPVADQSDLKKIMGES
jgi:hypothetical protein